MDTRFTVVCLLIAIASVTLLAFLIEILKVMAR